MTHDPDDKHDHDHAGCGHDHSHDGAGAGEGVHDGHHHDDPVEEAWCELLSAAEEDLAEGDLDLALANCDEAIELLPDEPVGYLLRAEILSAGGEVEEAVSLLRDVLAEDEEIPGARTILGSVLFEGCRFDEAVSELQRAVTDEPNDARAHFLLGVLEERRGNGERSRQLLGRAAKLEEQFRSVKPMSEAEFEAVVREALAELPEDVAKALENVSVQIDGFPEDELLRSVDPPFDPFLLGLFQGTPLGDKSFFDGAGDLPPTVIIFQRNLELACATREELLEQIAITVVHEIGHYLGLDEDDLAERGID